MSQERILRSFTGLRGIACLFVVLSHCAAFEISPGASLYWSGPMSVYFFFVLSGYLLIKRGLEDIKSKKDEAPKRFFGMPLVYYCIRRLFRIYPAYIIAVVIYKGMVIHAKNMNYYERIIGDYTPSITKSLYFSGARGQFWTLKPEFMFYLFLLPIVLSISSELMILDYKYLRNTRFNITVPFFIFLTISSVLLHYHNGNVKGGSHNFDDFHIHLPTFWYGSAAGIISYYLKIHNICLKIDTKFKKGIVEIITYGLLVRIALANYHLAEFYLKIPQTTWWNNIVATSPFYAILLLVLELTHTHNSVAEAMSTKFFYFMGEISYSTYLMHMLVLILFKMHCTLRGFDGTVETVLISFFVGYLYYVILENNSVKIGNFIIRRIKNRGLKQKKYIKFDIKTDSLNRVDVEANCLMK